jgi:acyl dehydratase
MTAPTTTEPVILGGPWFEDFHRGLAFDAPAVTLTAGHTAFHQALCGDRLRLPLDHHASRAVTGLDAPLVHPLVAIHIAIGQSTWASQRVKANLFYRGLVPLRPVFLGDTLHTLTRVVALRQNRPQAGRPATGIVALEITTINQRGETVLRFWRCPMIPCRDPQADTGHADDLEAIGRSIADDDMKPPRVGLPSGWRLDITRAWQGMRAADLQRGRRYALEARDTVTSAPELVRLSLNMAMAHTDARISYLGERIVYGGHTISMCFAQLTRAMPNLLLPLSWESCDHLAPVSEGDRLRTEFTVTDLEPVDDTAGGGVMLRICAMNYGAKGDDETETPVLDWKFWAWSL